MSLVKPPEGRRRPTTALIGACTFLLLKLGANTFLMVGAAAFASALAAHFQDVPASNMRPDLIVDLVGAAIVSGASFLAGLALSQSGMRHKGSRAPFATTLSAIAIAAVPGLASTVMCVSVAWQVAPVPYCSTVCDGRRWLELAVIANAFDFAAALGIGALSWVAADHLISALGKLEWAGSMRRRSKHDVAADEQYPGGHPICISNHQFSHPCSEI